MGGGNNCYFLFADEKVQAQRRELTFSRSCNYASVEEKAGLGMVGGQEVSKMKVDGPQG